MTLKTTPFDLSKPSATEYESAQAVIALENGFLVAWNANAGGVDVSVHVRRFDLNGKPVGAEIVLDRADAASGHFVTGMPELVDLGGEKIGVVWQVGTSLQGAVVDAAKGSAGATVTLADKVTNVEHEIAALPGGKIALVSNSATIDFPNLIENENLTILDSSLHATGPSTTFYSSKMMPYNFFEESVVGNGKGGVSFYRDHDNDQIYARNFDAHGKFEAAFKVNTTAMGHKSIFDAVMFASRRPSSQKAATSRLGRR